MNQKFVGNDYAYIKSKMNPDVYLAPCGVAEKKKEVQSISIISPGSGWQPPSENPFMCLTENERVQVKAWLRAKHSAALSNSGVFALRALATTDWWKQGLKWAEEL